jgi:proton glutamate symport protein
MQRPSDKSPPEKTCGLAGPATRILIGLAIGLAIGYFRPNWGVAIKPLADVFLRMIRMIVAPLVFSTLVVGIAGTGNLKAISRIALKAMIYFQLATTVALAIGIGLAYLAKPGVAAIFNGQRSAEVENIAQARQSVGDMLAQQFPASVVDAMSRGDILQIVIFATLFAIALAAVGARGRAILEVLDSTAQAMLKFTGYVMWFAPAGVMAAIAATVGADGPAVLLSVGKVVLLFYLGSIGFVLAVLGGVSLLIRMSFLDFLRTIREPVLIAYTTGSSAAALPKAIEVMENFGVPTSIAGFVLSLGYSFNLEGSTLYLALTTIFVAQLAHDPLTLSRQMAIILTLMLTSKGVATVPRASLVALAATLTQLHLPLEGVAILLGVDQAMDMLRGGVNVIGNCMATVVVAKWEGTLGRPRMVRRSAGI